MSASRHNRIHNLAARVGENKNGLREVKRTIVSVYILSSDDLMLLGRQDPAKGGTYPTAWRVVGGGAEEGETQTETAIREGRQEVIGLDLTQHPLTQLPLLDAKGAAEKTLESGEVVWQVMDFYHFEARLAKPAAELSFLPGDDLVELGWFTREERAAIELIPGGTDLMLAAGYIDPPVYLA